MAIDKKNIFLKTVKYLGITFGSILVVLFLTPIIFSDTIKEEVKKVLDEMLRDSKLMQEKLDKSIAGLVSDALEDAKTSFPSIETITSLQQAVVNLDKEQETMLEILMENIDDQNNKLKVVDLKDE